MRPSIRPSRVCRVHTLAPLTACILVAPAWAGGFAGFTSPARIPAGLQPSDVQVADVNGDQFADMLVLNQSQSTLTVLLGRGDGTFDRRPAVLTTSLPTAMAIGDFTDDQRPDVAVLSGAGATLAVHVNDGSGGFGVAQMLNIGVVGEGIVSAYFDGDPCADLVIAHRYAYRLTHLRSLGDGSFEVAATFDTPHYPWSIETADVNGDSRPDIGVGLLPGGQGNAIRILLNDGNGGFLAPIDTPIARQPVDLTFGDFNRDHLPDCATIDTSAGVATILRGDGTGAFASPQTYPFDGRPEEVEAFDVNDDGVDDVVAAHSYFHRVTTLVATGDGQFFFPVWQDVFAQAHDLAHGDFDGDGFNDIVVGHTLTGIDIVSILLNRSIPGDPATLEEVLAAAGRIEIGGVADIEHSENAYLQAAHIFGTVRAPGVIDLHVAARTDVASPALLNITLEAQITQDLGVEELRLFNWQTRSFDAIMENKTGLADRFNRALGVDAQPYVGPKGQIIASLRYSTDMRTQFGRFAALVDWVEIAVE